MSESGQSVYAQLADIHRRPAPFSVYTAEILWNDDHISKRMLAFHLDASAEPASRNRAFMQRSFEWTDGRFGIGPGLRICDLGCGPGLYAAHWAGLGARVTGVDFSLRSIEFARQSAADQGLDIDYVLCDYLTYSPDQSYDLITMIYCDLCPLSPKQRSAILKKIGTCLSDDGLVLLDVFSYSAFDQREEDAEYGHMLMDGFWSAQDYFGFLNIFKYAQEKVTLDKYTIIEQTRTWRVYNWLQYYSLESIHQEFEANGLRIIEYYADVAGSPYHPEATEIAVVARKM